MKTLLLICSLLLSLGLYAETKVTVFVELTPAGSFQAVSKKVKGNLFKTGDSFTSEKLTVSVESLKTGIDLRDEHTWKHLNSSKHEKITLTDLKASGGKGSALLEVNGVKKLIAITYKEVNGEVVANFQVKNSDFSLAKVSYLNVGVKDEIKVEAIVPFKAK